MTGSLHTLQLNPSTTPFNLEETLRCGQVFRWRRLGDWWCGVVGDQVVKLRQLGSRLVFELHPEGGGGELLTRYFRLDDNLPHILSQINRDGWIGRAIQSLYGLRIIRQDPWECLISYICATNTNIPTIRRMIANLCQRFGEEIRCGEHIFHTFPKPEALASASLWELRGCGLGFRARWVLQAARAVCSGELDVEGLKSLGYGEARRELMSLKGVGGKVADCILLFALEKLEAFPVDVWMKRIVLELYPRHFSPDLVRRALAKRSLTPREYEEISLFGRRYFGGYAGYAQEYLFHYFRGRRKGIKAAHSFSGFQSPAGRWW